MTHGSTATIQNTLAGDRWTRFSSTHLGWLVPVVVGILALIGLAASISNGLATIAVIIAALIATIVIAKPHVGLTLLIPSLFLEADIFSLDLSFGRFRLYHVLVALLFVRLMWDIARGKMSWRKTLLDWPLVAYLAINVATIALAPDKLIAVKISGLLVLLSMLYWVIIHYVKTQHDFLRMTKLFIGSSAVVALIGLYQVAAVWLEQRFDIGLWHGAVIHSDIIPFGRPYATFVEPDWLGAYMMAALVVTGTLLLSRAFAKRHLELLGLSGLFGVVTVLAAVRASWLGFVVAAVGLVWLNRRYYRQLNLRIVVPALVSIVVVVALAAIFFPDTTSAVANRLLTLTKFSTITNEPRFLIMQDGINVWLTSWLVGHGPGAYTILGTVPFVSPMQALILGLAPFQTNAILTTLIDTGVLGLVSAFWLLSRFGRTVARGLFLQTDRRISAVLLALSAALMGLAVTYQVTTGLWLGLTWFLAALVVAGSLSSPVKTQTKQL
jgi:hypothetical protein